jgi:ubiquinone/menaquinone biosynthesis C-methylase UbiE
MESRWLDVGCGTGALSHSILASASPVRVVGIDASKDYVAYASVRVTESFGTFAVGNARSLPAAATTFDVVVSGLMLNFLPEPERAVREMVRVIRLGGTVAVYVWDYAAGMQLTRHFWGSITTPVSSTEGPASGCASQVH